jgi:hypothetical protein
MRRVCAVITMALLGLSPVRGVAQRAQPAGVVSLGANALGPTAALSQATPMTLPAARSPTDAATPGHPWRWVGIGALAGALGGGTAAAVSMARSNEDVFFPALSIGMAALAGAFAGGALGGLAYVVSR